MTTREAFDEVCGYTLSLGDHAFIHQHVVDAYAAQTADATTKPIQLTFALVGLHLMLDRNHTGKAVQRAHQFLAQRKGSWPTLILPAARGSITAHDVLAQPPGPTRDRAIHEWCASIWSDYRDSHATIIHYLVEHGYGNR